MRPQLPVEVWVLSWFAVFWAVCLMWFPISLPDAGAMHFIQTHYFAPLELAVGLQVAAVGWMFWRTRRGTLCAPLVTSGLLAFTVVAVFLHFNFKAWMPLANPVLFDRLYASIDRAIAPGPIALCGLALGGRRRLAD